MAAAKAKIAVTGVVAGVPNDAAELVEVTDLAELISDELFPVADSPLIDLVSDSAGEANSWLVKVFSSDIIKYSYTFNGRTVNTMKLQLLLLSTIADQYCLAVAKLEKRNEEELKSWRSMFAPGTSWRLTKVKLSSEKSCYVSAPLKT